MKPSAYGEVSRWHAQRAALVGTGVFAIVLAFVCITHPLGRDEVRRVDLQTRIAINGASAADLELLPRIGPAIAQHIIDARNKLHGFHELKDLLKVKGIGPATVRKIAPLIRFAQPSSGAGAAKGPAQTIAAQAPLR